MPQFDINMEITITTEVAFTGLTAQELAEITELAEYGDGESLLERADYASVVESNVVVRDVSVS